MHYTNIETSRQLKAWGCAIQPEMSYFMSKWMKGKCDFDIEETENVLKRVEFAKGEEDDFQIIHYPAYDLLWDVCVKYATEFWGHDDFTSRDRHIKHIIALLQLSYYEPKRVIEANEYLLENTIFNPKNK